MKIRLPLNILMVDDDPGDVFLTRETLAENSMPVNLFDVKNGAEAIAFLRKEDAYQNRPEPDLVLMDLNLPGMNGKQVLEYIKKDSRLRQIPVIVFSTSSAETDIRQSYVLGANSYISKPIELDEFTQVIKDIGQFWMKIARLPEKC